MKKILLTGIVILLAAFVVTCEEFFPEEKPVEYTDVVYSKDGSQVTVYLDGIGVPKTQAQRAMSLGLSEMAYDFIEVIFVSNTGTVARSQWELGESAGISGVRRGISYVGLNPGTGQGQALMAVGTKDGKTLLGVGHIVANGPYTYAGGTFPTAPVPIGTGTNYVVFGLYTVKTALKAGDGTPTEVGTTDNSLAFLSPDAAINTNSIASPLGDSDYPMFSLPSNAADTAREVKATYTFRGAADTYRTVLVWGTPVARKRIPRYMTGGRYMIPRGRIDTKTTVTASAGDTGTENVIPLSFKIPKGTSGIFSFYVEVPVNLLYAFGEEPGTNGGDLDSVNWFLRTGFGADLYSLDDGLSSGGCVLMGVNVGALDWLEIQWIWEKAAPSSP